MQTATLHRYTWKGKHIKWIDEINSRFSGFAGRKSMQFCAFDQPNTKVVSLLLVFRRTKSRVAAVVTCSYPAVRVRRISQALLASIRDEISWSLYASLDHQLAYLILLALTLVTILLLPACLSAVHRYKGKIEVP